MFNTIIKHSNPAQPFAVENVTRDVVRDFATNEFALVTMTGSTGWFVKSNAREATTFEELQAAAPLAEFVKEQLKRYDLRAPRVSPTEGTDNA